MSPTEERKVMNAVEEREEETAEEMEWANEEREEAHREEDRSEREDLNQGIQTGTHDTIHRGVHWPPSYRVRRRAAKTTEAAPEETKDSK